MRERVEGGVSGVSDFVWFEDEDDIEEEFDIGNISLGDFEIVGHGEVTNANCGRFSGYFYGCLRVELHNKVGLNGVNYAGKIYRVPYFHSCNKPSCPICYKHGWAVRLARSIEARLKEGSKRFGDVEHIVVGLPSTYFHLSLELMKLKVIKGLKNRGVVGGVLIFHGFRLKKPQFYWYWSPHFHVLGYIFGGFGRCRHCHKHWSKENCNGCGGYQDRTFREYEKDSLIMKVKGKRKTVFGTVWYALEHSSHKKGSVRFHVATYFGNISYHKMKVTAEMRKRHCPICLHDLVKIRYHGSELDPWLLAFSGDGWSKYEEQPQWRILEREVVWQEVVSESKKYSYDY